MVKIIICIDIDLTNKWLNRLRVTSTTHDSKDKLGQIQNLIDFYNKPAQASALPVSRILIEEKILMRILNRLLTGKNGRMIFIHLRL